MENVTLSEAEVKEIESEEQQTQQRIAENKEKAKTSEGLRNIITQTQSKERFDTVLKGFQAAEEEGEGEEAAEATAETEKPEDTEEQETAETEQQEEAEDTAGEPESDEGEEEPADQEDSDQYPEWLQEKLAEIDEDIDISDEEQLQKTFTNLVEDSKALAKEREANQVVYDLFENHDELVELAQHMHKGDSFMVALARTVDLDKAQKELEADNPEEFKEMLRAQVEREQKLKEAEKKQQDLEEEFEENTEQSLENMEQFFKKEGMDEAAQDEFRSKVDTHISRLMKGKVTPEFLEVLHKGLNYEVDVEKAKEKGKVEGKNAKIKAERTKKKGDGLPNVKGGGPKETKKPDASRGKRALTNIVTSSKSTFG
nr:hypothetical protein 15 [Balneolaceae bacterium]